MLYKLRSIIICCSICLFITVLSSNAALANKRSSRTAATSLSVKTLVNINSADVDTLQKVKGMSKKKAQAIIDYRAKNGPFKSLEDLLNVSFRGISKNWLKKVRKFLTV